MRLLCAAIATLLAAGPLFAHHAWPVDRSKEVTVKGTVTAYTWSDPHVMIALDVATATGAVEKECGRAEHESHGRQRLGQGHTEGRRCDHRDWASLRRRLERSAAAEDRDGQRQRNVAVRPARRKSLKRATGADDRA